jgi:chromosome segregation ATPase
MAKAIATQETVNAAANAMLQEGLEPSIVKLQERIGGGSYSTVKRYLDVWSKAKEEEASAAPQTPAALESQGRAMIRTLWAMAYQETQAESKQVKDQAAAEVAAIAAELNEARIVIGRLESTEEEQSAIIERQQSRLREIEIALVEAQVHARRATEMEQAVAALRSELEAARAQAAQKSVEVARLTGEADALRRQALELMGALRAMQPQK